MKEGPARFRSVSAIQQEENSVFGLFTGLPTVMVGERKQGPNENVMKLSGGKKVHMMFPSIQGFVQSQRTVIA